MKKINKFFSILVFICVAFSSCNKASKEINSTDIKKETSRKFQFENGDIIFQTSLSSQSKAIQLATKSKYSHCGILFDEAGWKVYEATSPNVTMTPIDEWIAKGENKKFVVKRLKKSELIDKNYKKFCDAANVFYQKKYDGEFNWSNEKAYCSELVWKTYKVGLGIELSKLKNLKDFDLSNKIVKQKLNERYRNKIPLDELVISPQAIFESDKLETVKVQ